MTQPEHKTQPERDKQSDETGIRQHQEIHMHAPTHPLYRALSQDYMVPFIYLSVFVKFDQGRSSFFFLFLSVLFDVVHLSIEKR